MKVSVIIPAKNEERNIADIITAARPYADELLVVDGHSQDRTSALAQELGVRVVTDGGQGKGDGVRSGIKAASGEILVFIDADGSHDAHDIPRLIAPIQEGKADLVIASRRTGGSDELYGNFNKFLRETGSHIITLLINHRFGVFLTDSQNGFRAMRKEMAQQLLLRENTTTIEQEILIKALRGGFRVHEVPSHERVRRYGHSVITLKRVWWRYLYSCFKYLYFSS